MFDKSLITIMYNKIIIISARAVQDLVSMRRQIKSRQEELYEREQGLKNIFSSKDNVESRKEGEKGAGLC